MVSLSLAVNFAVAVTLADPIALCSATLLAFCETVTIGAVLSSTLTLISSVSTDTSLVAASSALIRSLKFRAILCP